MEEEILKAAIQTIANPNQGIRKEGGEAEKKGKNGGNVRLNRSNFYLFLFFRSYFFITPRQTLFSPPRRPHPPNLPLLCHTLFPCPSCFP
jgi:hypothetical protein